MSGQNQKKMKLVRNIEIKKKRVVKIIYKSQIENFNNFVNEIENLRNI